MFSCLKKKFQKSFIGQILFFYARAYKFNEKLNIDMYRCGYLSKKQIFKVLSKTHDIEYINKFFENEKRAKPIIDEAIKRINHCR